jgi:selenocysteine lyase/cysteine desulfurase
VHEHLGTATAGTVRASFGPGNDRDDVDAVLRVVETIRG